MSLMVKCLRRIMLFSRVCGLIPFKKLSTSGKITRSKTLTWIFVVTKTLLMAYFAVEFYSQYVFSSHVVVDGTFFSSVVNIQISCTFIAMVSSLKFSAVICFKLSRILSNLHIVEVKVGQKSEIKTFCRAFGVYQILTIAHGVTTTTLLATSTKKGNVIYVLNFFYLCIFTTEQVIVCISICLRKLLQLTKDRVLMGELVQKQVFLFPIMFILHCTLCSCNRRINHQKLCESWH
jgi:hypothetical protein